MYFLTSFLPTWSCSYYVVIICGDFNYDSVDDPDSVKFRDLLESVGLRQHVKKSAHNNGHILDRIITRFTDTAICKEPQVDRFRSDHASLICHVYERNVISSFDMSCSSLEAIKLPYAYADDTQLYVSFKC